MNDCYISIYKIHNKSMQQLHWPLSVLSQAIAYKNLTGASQHVGLSQPQLSRIVKQLEEDLGVTLLDRSSPRHSTWTPEARRIAEVYHSSQKALDSALIQVIEEAEQKEVHMGCLDGLWRLAGQYANTLLNESGVQKVYLNIYDLNYLESKFLAADLDVVFTSRSPGNRKLKYEKTLGHQVFEEKTSPNSSLRILSSFEDGGRKRKTDPRKILVSNSLHLRRGFQELYGGKVTLPSPIKTGKAPKTSVPVLALGQEYFSEKLWGLLEKI